MIYLFLSLFNIKMLADVEEEFMPWLMKEIKKELGTMIRSRSILEGKSKYYYLYNHEKYVDVFSL
jgi:hypothetical protein